MKTQRCDLCDEPTGRCEDDTIRLPSDTVVCPDCWDRSVQGWPSTGSLERFDLVKASSGDYHHDHVMEPCKTGEWVRWEDAADAIRAAKFDTLRALIPEVQHCAYAKGFRITKHGQVSEYEFVADAPEPAAPFILRSSEGVNYGVSATLEAAKDHARLICLKGYEIWHKGTPVVVVEPHRYLSPAPGELHAI